MIEEQRISPYSSIQMRVVFECRTYYLKSGIKHTSVFVFLAHLAYD